MPSAAGIRIGGEKYIFIKHDSDEKVTDLSNPNGGASICRTRNAILVSIWNKSDVMSNN